MEIIPPRDFRDGRKVKVEFTKYDPRVHSFPASLVIINLTGCSRVHTPAILWCAVFLSLWNQRGYDCLLLLPKSEYAVGDLTDSGILDILRERNIQVHGDNTYPSGSTDVILPLTRFDSLREAAELTNKVEDSLHDLGSGSANIRPLVSELFSELVNNAAEHSQSRIGAYGFVQFYLSGPNRRFICGVADGGIGIGQSLGRNLTHEHTGYEWSAIELATKELVSGTSSSTRGIGLFSVFEEMRLHGRELVIHSGKGILTKSADSQIRMIRANLFPGTLVHFSLPA